MSYRENGKLVRGFALVAYPAAYGTSGVMTFVVNQSGVVSRRTSGRRPPASPRR